MGAPYKPNPAPRRAVDTHGGLLVAVASAMGAITITWIAALSRAAPRRNNNSPGRAAGSYDRYERNKQ